MSRGTSQLEGGGGVGAVGRPAPGRRRLRGPARVYAWTAFPAVLALTHWGGMALMEAGVEPALSVGPPIAAAYLFLALSEWWLPWHRSWLRPRGDLGTDVGLFLVNTAVTGLATPVVLAGGALAGTWLAARIGAGLWPVGIALWLQLPLALVVAELVEYSFHRAMHEVPWLWRFHVTHHSAPRLYWLNAVRFHPIDLFLVGTVKLVPLAVLGAGPEVFALVTLFSGVHGAFQHANVPVRLGPLNWVFSMTELHRWHHAPEPELANHNYGGNLIVWDVVFGTRFLPRDREPPEAIGIRDLPAFPRGLIANLLAPFRWGRVVERASSPDR